MPTMNTNFTPEQRAEWAREAAAALRANGLHKYAADLERTAHRPMPPATASDGTAFAIAQKLAAAGVNVRPALIVDYSADECSAMRRACAAKAKSVRDDALLSADDDADLAAAEDVAAELELRARLWGDLGAALYGAGWDTPQPSARLEAARRHAGVPTAGPRAPAGRGAPGRDIGDAVVELWEAKAEGREPAEWARGMGGGTPTAQNAEIERLCGQALDAVRGTGGRDPMGSSPSTTHAPTPQGDIGDQVADILEARRRSFLHDDDEDEDDDVPDELR